jgi:dTDP-4-dehydrorhamnose reductase
MLGRDLVAVLRDAGAQVTAAGSRELDVRRAEECREAAKGHDVVVNCAAWTAVDDAESDEAAAFAVNATGAANLAAASATAGARMVQVSTDYVFDGTAREPYAEDSPLEPASAYGRTKAAGEWATRAEHPDVLVVRTAWLYGEHGRCFPRTIDEVLSRGSGCDVVTDQVGQPTWTADVAALVLALVQAEAPAGAYHATSSGSVSWHGFAQAVARAGGHPASDVRETTSDRFVRPAPRPAFSVLGHRGLADLGLAPIGDWRERFEVSAPRLLSAPAGRA